MKEQLSSFQVFIDFRDIRTTEILKLINEKALMQDSDQIQEAYKDDYLIQIDLTTTNGLSLHHSDDRSQKVTIANIFFKVIPFVSD